MGGPNLEVFKFGFYMFFPVLVMLRFGDPEWQETYVKPYKEYLWPTYESTHKPPKTSEELQAEMARLKQERIARWQRNAASREGGTLTAEEVPAGSAVMAELNRARGGQTNERMV